MFGFDVHGVYNYLTKLGAIFTLIYWSLVMATFTYYIFKSRDKSKPLVMWNEYRGQAYPETDLLKENFHFYILPVNLAQGKFLSWFKILSFFSVYTSFLEIGELSWKTNDFWTDIPIQKCEEQEWAKALPKTDKGNNAIRDYGICRNLLKMFKSKFSDYKGGHPIRGKNKNGIQRVVIDFYQCLHGLALPTKGVRTTCDAE